MHSIPIVVIDTETGGLDCQTNALLSIGAYNLLTGEKFYAQMKANESLHCNAIALKVNGLNPLFGEDERDVMHEFKLWIHRQGSHILAGANTAFDIGFLNKAFERQFIVSPLGHRVLDVISMALMAHMLGKLTLPVLHDIPCASLDAILQTIGLSRPTLEHNSLTDAILTAEAIKTILSLF
jgi:DNA polymerase III epsilon subunit-like protein